MKNIELIEDTYLQISFGYCMTLLLPYEEGMQMIAYLKNAFVYDTPHNNLHTINKLHGEPKLAIVDSNEIREDIKRAEVKYKETQLKKLVSK